MRKNVLIFILITSLLLLAACNSEKEVNSNKEMNHDQVIEKSESDTQIIKHLGEEYTVPANVEKIVIVGAIEAMEDAMVLDVKPIGANTTGGEFPEIFSTVLSDATPIGEKTQPNLEEILQLKPDVILVSTKFPEETKEKLSKLAPMIPYSHISEDWQDNLFLLAELTGNEEKATEAIHTYESNLEKAKQQLEEGIKDKQVLAIRIRRGDLFIYPENVFLNSLLYEDLGFNAPEEVKAASAQEMITIEKVSEMNPDYIFIQYEESSNSDTPQALEDIEKNPIWQSLRAVNDGNVFVNVIDPILEGGPLFSKNLFLQAAVENLVD